MKRFTFFLVVLFAFSLSGFGQDILIKSNGDEIRAKVLEVGIDIIKYKMYDNPDGPLYNISKKDVFMIKYENGSKETFKIETPPEVQQNQTQLQNNTTNNINKTPPIYRMGYTYYSNGVRLNYEDVETIISGSKNTSVLTNFQSGKKLYEAGQIVKYIGIPFFVAGCVTAVFYGINSNMTYLIAGASTMGAGLVLGAAGGGVASSGKSKMAAAVDSYNVSLNTSEIKPFFKLNFGCSYNTLGVGITYNF